jgi:hypothetical protein
VCIVAICAIFLYAVQPVSAGDFLDPIVAEIEDAWLTSNPQAGVDYHVIRACQDEEMTIDCTQSIYKAKSDGAVWIPVNNRCIFRVQTESHYSLFYQVKAMSLSGLSSDWTIPREVSVYRSIGNLEQSSHVMSAVNYMTQSTSSE